MHRLSPDATSVCQAALDAAHAAERESWQRSVAAALGLTSVLLFWFVAPLLSPTHAAVYHWSGTGSSLFLPVLADWLLLWFALTALFRSAAKKGPWRNAVWLPVASLLPFACLKSWAFYTLSIPSHTLSHVLFFGGFATLAALFLLWRVAFPRQIERLIRLTCTLLVLLSFSGLLLVAEMLYFGAKASALSPGLIPPHASQAAMPGPPPPHRVFWIIFDELSFQQVFSQRYPGLQLPAFDALAAQSTVFSHTVPAGYLTERVLPSLMTGKTVADMRPSASGDPRLFFPGTGWAPLDPRDTVFQDARNAGYSTATVGWYNPYCRFLDPVLDRCSWFLDAPLQNGLVPHASLLRNMLVPLTMLVSSDASQRVLGGALPIQSAAVHEADLHAQDLASFTTASDVVLRDPSLGFVFLHLPVPHLPGIYNRREHHLANAGSDYLDNLALADACLAHIREILEQTHQWNSSTVVLMGDHGWRIPLWRARESWTPEEEQSSNGGRFDDRPLYLVKLPGQQTGSVVAGSFPALRTRALLDAALQHRLSSPAELAAWASGSAN